MTWPVRLTRRRVYIPDELKGGRAVVLAACVLIAAHLAVRTWALYGGGWFYTDDFRLLFEARTSPLSFETLLRPYGIHLMPGGRFLAWVVEASGPLNWTFAATLSLALQAMTSAACFLMLRSLFGLRPGILAPLSFYLFTAIPFPAFMWWAASLNQLPMQLALFLAVWAWVGYLRRPGARAALLTLAAVALGLAFYVKTLLFLPVLALMAPAYFARGGPLGRLWFVVRRYWLGLAALVVVGGVFSAYYLTSVPEAGPAGEPPSFWGLLGTYAGTSFGTTLLGGPWLWWQDPNPPTSQLDVPSAVVVTCWVVIALVVATTAVLRRRTLRAWGLVAVYLAASFALLLTSRGFVGSYVGLELRYLTDLAVVVALAIGLAYLPLLGAQESSEPRAIPVLRLPYAREAGVALLALACIGGVVSTYGHARIWHEDNPGRRYVNNAVAGIRAHGGVVNIADDVAPPDVMIQWTYPHNLVSRFLPLTGAPVRFPRVTEELYALDLQGRLRRVDVQPGVTATPGDDPGCGWLVRSTGRSIPMKQAVPRLDLWMRIGYMSSADGEILLTAGAQRIRVPVRGGLHDVYVRTNGDFSRVRVDGLSKDQALCVTDLDVGLARAGDLP